MQCLRAKLIGLLILCSSVPIAFLGWRNDTLAYRDFWGQVEHSARSAADHAAEMVDDFLAERLQHLSDMANEVMEHDNGLAGLKTEMRHHARFWDLALVADRSGRVVLCSDSAMMGRNLSGRDFFEKALEGKPYVSGVWVVKGKPVVALATPVLQPPIRNHKSRIHGVLVAYIPTDPLRHLLETVTSSIGRGAFGVLVDENLISLAHTSNPSHELRPLAPLPESVRQQFVAQRRLGDQTEALVQSAAHPPKCGAKVTGAVHSIDRWSFQRMESHMPKPVHLLGTRLRHHGWTVLVCVPDSAVASQIASHHRLSLTTAVLVMLTAVLLGLFFSQRLVSPIENLTEAAKRMGGGDLAARAEEKGSGEVAVLARSFNQMAENVQNRSQEMVKANQVLQSEISERKLAEESLARLRQQAESVLNSAGEGIFGLEAQGNHTFVNLAAASMLGYTVEELIGRHGHSTWHHTKADGAPYPNEECPICAALRDGTVYRVTEEVFWRKDGTSFPVEYVSTPIREQGAVTGAVVVFRDVTERREAEEEYRTLVHTAMDGFWILDTKGRVLDVNDSYCRLSGYSRAELLTMELSDIEAVQTPDEIGQKIEEVIRVGWARFEAHHRRKDGSIMDVEVSTNYRPANGGRFIAFLRDITERKRAEARLQEESAVNAALLDLETALGKALGITAVCGAAVELVPSLVAGARGFVWLWDEERNRLRPVASPASLTEDQRATFFSPDIPYEREHDFAEVLRTHEVLVVDDATRDSRVNQEAVRIFGTQSFILAPLMAGDQILGVMSVERGEAGAFSDREIELTRAAAQRIGMALSGEGAREEVQQQLSRVSLLNQTARAIQQRQDVESVFRVVLHTLEREMPVDIGAVLSCDPDNETFTIAAVGTKNSALLTELGLTEGTQIPMDDALRACLKNETVYVPDNSEFEAPAPRKLGQAGIGSSVLVPLTVEGKLKGILIAARREADSFNSSDCEFLRQLAEHVALVLHHAGLYQDLQKAYDELQSAQQTMMQQERLQALGQLASGIAHDINNALSPVVGFSELLLLQGGWDERTQNNLEAISTAGNDIAAVVSRLREFYRKREGQEPLMPVDVYQLVKMSVSLTQPRWRDMPMERGVVIGMNNEVPKGLPSLLGNEAELREALTNLIINAVDAMPEGGTITLRARVGERENGRQEEAEQRVSSAPPFSHSPAHLILEISDTGVGMSDEVRLRCLEPFYSTKGERGTGMGLSMVHGILRRHEGEIDIRTAPGQGTTFVLRLPITRETREEATPKRETVKPLRVLCVDDDPRLRQLLPTILTQFGHHVEVAEGGQEGIDAFDPGKFDVVITDLGMPVVDGRAVAKAIEERSPETPVILLTGWGTRMHAEGESPEGVDLVLGKPVKPEELQDALRRVTEPRAEGRA